MTPPPRHSELRRISSCSSAGYLPLHLPLLGVLSFLLGIALSFYSILYEELYKPVQSFEVRFSSQSVYLLAIGFSVTLILALLSLARAVYTDAGGVPAHSSVISLSDDSANVGESTTM